MDCAPCALQTLGSKLRSPFQLFLVSFGLLKVLRVCGGREDEHLVVREGQRCRLLRAQELARRDDVVLRVAQACARRRRGEQAGPGIPHSEDRSKIFSILLVNGDIGLFRILVL